MASWKDNKMEDSIAYIDNMVQVRISIWMDVHVGMIE